MQALFWPIVSWIFRAIIIRFVVFSAIVGVVALLVPYAVGYLGDFIGVGGLNNALLDLPAGVWYFLDYCQIPYGLPLVISAFVSRFLIRRLPVIG